MAIKYLTSIDLRTNELQYASIHPLTTAPTALTAQLGQVYFNTSDNKLKIYTSGGWQTVGGVTSITAGTAIGVTNDPATGIFTVSHADTSSVSNLIASGRTYVTGLTFDTLGHVTGFTTGTETVVDTNTTYDLSVVGQLSGASLSLIGSDSTTDSIFIGGTPYEINVGAVGTTLSIGLPDDVIITNDLTVGGNLTVNGTVTTINTETINLADNIILLNSNAVGIPTENAGIEVERGTLNNVSIIWNEAADKWQATEDGITFHNILTTVNAGSYVQNVGDGVNTSFALSHGLNSRDVRVEMFDNSTYETIYSDVVRTSATQVTVSFTSPPAANSIRVLISKVG
jgi:hypothetical protein